MDVAIDEGYDRQHEPEERPDAVERHVDAVVCHERSEVQYVN